MAKHRRIRATARTFAPAAICLAWMSLRAVPAPAQENPNDPLPTELTGPITDEELHLPVDARLAERIERVVQQLDSPVFKDRDAASEALLEIGAPAFARLKSKYAETRALDVRLAIEEVVQTGYLNYHVFDRQGFLGVSLSPAATDLRARPAAPADIRGVIVIDIVAGTGAERAGLEPRDMVVAVDGASLTAPPNQIVTLFAASIRARRPGTPMTLKVLRGTQELEIEAIVGRCPPEQIATGRVAAIPELLHRARQRFPIWWETYFNPNPRPTLQQRDAR